MQIYPFWTALWLYMLFPLPFRCVFLFGAAGIIGEWMTWCVMCVDSWIFDGEMHYPNVSQSAPALVRSSSLTVICPWHGQSVPHSILGGTQCKQWFNAPSSSGRLLCHLPAWHIKLGGKQAMLENICLFFFFTQMSMKITEFFFSLRTSGYCLLPLGDVIFIMSTLTLLTLWWSL